MACALVMPCAVVPHKFKGDSSELLDRLVEVCNSVKVVNNAKVVERELQPFCFDNAPPLPKPASRSPPKGHSPRCSPPKQQKAFSGSSPSAHRKTDPASCTSSSRRGSLDSVPMRTPKQPMSSGSRFVSLDSAEDLARVLRGPASISLQTSSNSAVRACPGFFSSPRPSDLPMPTSSLLVKATLVKA